MSNLSALQSDRTRLKRLGLGAKTVLVLVAAYLAFWMLATYAEHSAKPAGFGTHSSITFAPLSASGTPLLDAQPQRAIYKPPYRYMSWLWDEDVAGGRVRIAVPPHPNGQPLALMLSARSDVLAVRLNGREIEPDIRAPRLPGAFVSEPSFYRLPDDLWTERGDVIELDIKRSLRDPIIFPDFAIGPVVTLAPAFAWRNFMAVEAPLIGIVLLMFSILFYVMIAGPDVDRTRNLAFVGTLAFSAISASFFLLFDQSRFDFELYTNSITIVTLLLSFCAISYSYIDYFRNYLSKRAVFSFALSLMIVCIALSIHNYNGKPERFFIFNAYITAQLFATGALGVASIGLAWEIAKGGAARFAERFLLIICFGAIALDRSGVGLFNVYSPLARDTPLSLQWMPIIGSLVGFTMVFVLAKHAEFARKEILSASITLRSKLAEREAQLRDIYASREKILAEQATNEERQRIMRDMHDGLGSNLMSMLLAARRGDAEPAKVAEGLQSVIDEMRLLIDSMDSVGESLGSAFAIFRDRVQPRVKSAGMTFVWLDQTGGDLPDFGPRNVLQVFRIMQEAVTNALKHSRGNVLQVTLSFSPDPAFALRLAIADDGAGMGKANPRGKGLTSMASRASEIGGRVDVVTGGRGVTVLLDLPAARSDTGMP